MDRVVELIDAEPLRVAVRTGRVGHGGVGPFIGQSLGEVLAAVGPQGVTGPPFCRIDMADGEFLLEVGFPVADGVAPPAPVEVTTLPGGPLATVLHAGPFDQVAPLYGFLERWFADHGYRPDGAPWETYLDGPDVPMPRTRVCWPCRPA